MLDGERERGKPIRLGRRLIGKQQGSNDSSEEPARVTTQEKPKVMGEGVPNSPSPLAVRETLDDAACLTKHPVEEDNP
jgi:hypothetical protein